MPTRSSFRRIDVEGPSTGAPPTARTLFASGSSTLLGEPPALDSIAPPAKRTARAAATRPIDESAGRRDVLRNRLRDAAVSTYVCVGSSSRGACSRVCGLAAMDPPRDAALRCGSDGVLPGGTPSADRGGPYEEVGAEPKPEPGADCLV